MSRSHRKKPILATTNAQSERDDKKIWHGRWRSSERESLARLNAEGLEAHLPLLEKQVSNPWSMNKDGRSYRSRNDLAGQAKFLARKGRTLEERISLEKRMLHQLMNK